MPRYALELECSVEDKASLVALAKSRTAEAHAVERARIILACLEGKEIQQVARDYSPHKGNDDWLAKFEGRVQFHFTPTSASWLNQIEIVFSLLQRKTLNGASFKTKDQLREAIEAFIRRHNERAKPFRWRKREVKGSQLQNTIINLRN